MKVKVAAAALNQIPLAWEHNFKNIEAAILQAKEANVDFLCLPELCITGYGCEDTFHSKSVLDKALDILNKRIAPLCKNISVSVGLPVVHKGAVYNAACLISDGNPLGLVAKKYLAGDGIHYEPRWFKPWPKGVVARLGNTGYVFGDIHFRINGVIVGFEICEDAWVYDRPGRQLASQGVDIILNPSASHFAFGKHEVRKGFVVEGSRAFNCVYVYANLLGNESGRVIYDGDTIIASGGTILDCGKRFSYNDVEVVSAVVDLDVNRTSRVKTASFVPNPADDDESLVHGFMQSDFASNAEDITSPAKLKTYCKEEEFQKAVSLGLFDFMRKSKSKGYVVSLSGGADSSAVSCLVKMMLEDALNELGLDGVRRKLNYISGVDELNTLEKLTNKFLTCVYQGSENSSSTTFNAAEALAKELNATFINLDIGSLVAGYCNKIAEAIDRDLSWETDDIALQNIQARVRGPSVWMLANIKNAILLATSNRSEAAVGYATMDGDTCGGLSPIAGIDKAYLRKWLVSIESKYPSLSLVNRQAPTAELRPADKNQTDEDDLMPYPVLDKLEKYSIRDKKSPLEIFNLLRNEYEHLQLARWIDKFFKLWCRNQWKRERYAPSFHLDDENLDPKTWCRFPILNSGFELELAEMWELVGLT